MQKWLIAVAVIILGALGFYALNSYIYNEKQGGSIKSANTAATTETSLAVTPISHASMVISLGGQVIYNDPVGGGEAFAGQPAPNIILVSDIHGDHLSPDTLSSVSAKEVVIVVPRAVVDVLPKNLPGSIVVLANGQKTTQKGIEIEAFPMYNVPDSADARHPKGRGNGYILSAQGQRVYIAGDTDFIPEMRSLTDIDVAFVPMNPPFTMPVEEAADAVLAFQPKVVHPYHYRGQEGLSDIKKFKELVEAGASDIKVELLNFYPEQ